MQVDFTENGSSWTIQPSVAQISCSDQDCISPQLCGSDLQELGASLQRPTNPSGTCLLAPESPSSFFCPTSGQVSDSRHRYFPFGFLLVVHFCLLQNHLGLFSLLLSSSSSLLSLESTFPLGHSHPSLLLPHNTVEAAASCTWLWTGDRRLVPSGPAPCRSSPPLVSGRQDLSHLCLGWGLGEAVISSLVVCPVSWQPKAMLLPQFPG